MMNKILILGSPGGGKSTLARRLEGILDVPAYHLDKIHWQPGWIEPEETDFIRRQEAILAQPQWIIDGNYFRTLHLRLPPADTIIFLDIRRRIYMPRIIMRIVRNYGRVRPDMGAGCPERLDWTFITWAWSFRETYRPEIIDKIKQFATSTQIITLSRRKDVEKFVVELQTSVRQRK